jgi:G3E family GTPase
MKSRRESLGIICPPVPDCQSIVWPIGSPANDLAAKSRAMIPVTVIGGFLGAGKTTLINHLLRHAGRRYAVLVNDFGAVNIDAALIAARRDAVIALTNGCICCTIGDDLGAALAALAGRSPPPEQVLIETSGVADPWQVAQLCLIEPGFALDPIVVVADAAALRRQLADAHIADTVVRQLGRADLVILNKTDRASPAERSAASAAIARLRPDAVIREADHGAVPERLFEFAAAAHRAGPGDPGHGHDDHPFRSWLWHDPRAFDRDRLRALLRGLPASVLRIKGWCRLGGAGEWRLLNYAGGQWNLAPAPPPAAGAVLVLVGTPAMPAPAALEEMFEAALF